jgi:hypothetical protein
MKRRPSLCWPFLLLCLPATALIPEKDVVVEHAAGYSLDWSNLTLSIDVTVPAGTWRNDMPARREAALFKARSLAGEALYAALRSIPVDAETDFGGLLRRRPGLHRRLQNMALEQAKPFFQPLPGKTGLLRYSLTLPLAGNQSILAELLEIYPLLTTPPLSIRTNAGYHHSGLVIDARHLPFRPALGTRIFNSDGRLVYDPSIAENTVYRDRAHLLFVADLKAPAVRERAGDRFLYTFAREIRIPKQDPAVKAAPWPYGTDLVIGNEEAEQLLVSPVTRRGLRAGRVVVVCRMK